MPCLCVWWLFFSPWAYMQAAWTSLRSVRVQAWVGAGRVDVRLSGCSGRRRWKRRARRWLEGWQHWGPGCRGSPYCCLHASLGLSTAKQNNQSDIDHLEDLHDIISIYRYLTYVYSTLANWVVFKEVSFTTIYEYGQIYNFWLTYEGEPMFRVMLLILKCNINEQVLLSGTCCGGFIAVSRVQWVCSIFLTTCRDVTQLHANTLIQSEAPGRLLLVAWVTAVWVAAV